MRWRRRNCVGKKSDAFYKTRKEIRYTWRVKWHKLREKFLNDKHLYTNEETAYRRMTSFTKITELKNWGKLLYKLKCKWDKHVEENGASFGRGGAETLHYITLHYITYTSTLFYRITLQNRRNSKWYILVFSNKYSQYVPTKVWCCRSHPNKRIWNPTNKFYLTLKTLN